MSWVFPDGRVPSNIEPLGYDVAEVCRTGHMITAFAATRPERRQKFCTRCGSPTLDRCEHCNANIRGHYHVPRVRSAGPSTPPAFCHGCGEPYPWTSERLNAAKQLVVELEDLSPDDRQRLARSLDDIVRDTPTSSIAITQVKKALGKLKKPAAELLSKVVAELATAAIKKQLGV